MTSKWAIRHEDMDPVVVAKAFPNCTNRGWTKKNRWTYWFCAFYFSPHKLTSWRIFGRTVSAILTKCKYEKYNLPMCWTKKTHLMVPFYLFCWGRYIAVHISMRVDQQHSILEDYQDGSSHWAVAWMGSDGASSEVELLKPWELVLGKKLRGEKRYELDKIL